jgi:uncharacterized membrane protein YfcA
MLSAALRILATTALGGAAGFFGGLFGVGGGAIAIPLLGLLYHLDQQTAQGTTLVMVVPNVLLGFWRYRRQVGIDLRIAGALAISAMASTYTDLRKFLDRSVSFISGHGSIAGTTRAPL